MAVLWLCDLIHFLHPSATNPLRTGRLVTASHMNQKTSPNVQKEGVKTRSRVRLCTEQSLSQEIRKCSFWNVQPNSNNSDNIRPSADFGKPKESPKNLPNLVYWSSAQNDLCRHLCRPQYIGEHNPRTNPQPRGRGLAAIAHVSNCCWEPIQNPPSQLRRPADQHGTVERPQRQWRSQHIWSDGLFGILGGIWSDIYGNCIHVLVHFFGF